MAIRFILGIVEAAVMPAMLIYISNWFTKTERSRANTFLILGNRSQCCGCRLSLAT
jgi:MFS family permease